MSLSSLPSIFSLSIRLGILSARLNEYVKIRKNLPSLEILGNSNSSWIHRKRVDPSLTPVSTDRRPCLVILHCILRSQICSHPSFSFLLGMRRSWHIELMKSLGCAEHRWISLLFLLSLEVLQIVMLVFVNQRVYTLALIESSLSNYLLL